MLHQKPALLLLVLAAAAAAQDLPPGVLLLSRIKRHVREEAARLPDYTCLQTSVRYRREPGKKPRETPTDVMALEVLFTGSKELYASPGARNFAEDRLGAFAAGGLTGTGLFGLFLKTIFVNDNAMFQYRGEEQLAGRRAVRYDYRVPLVLSGYTIQLAYTHGQVAMKGAIWADPVTLDLLWLEVHADEIPPNLELISAVQTVEYARTRIGDRDVMLPQSAVMKMLQTDGEDSSSFIEFTHCRSFAVESRISFDSAPPAALPTPTSPRAEPAPISSGLVVPMELTSPITVRQTVGSLIEARIAADVVEKKKVVIPAGATVHGRIRRLERHNDDYFIVGVEFTEIAMPTGMVRFSAQLFDIDTRGNVRLVLQGVGTGPRRTMRIEDTYLAYVPGVASFFVRGPTLTVPKGFRIVWKTVSPRAPIR